MFSKSRFCFLTFSDLNLKVVSIDVSLPKPRVIFYDQVQLPSGIVFDDEIIDLIRFKEETRKLLFSNESNFASNKVVLAINEQDVFFNQFILKDSTSNLKDEIEKFLQTKLPYEIKATTVHFKKISADTYQILSTKQQLIKDLASIFENTNFELSKIELLPYACLNLLSKETEPYIFILSEDLTLQFALVIDKVLIFSASIKISKGLKEAKTQFIKTVKKLILEYEATKNSNVNIKNVFVVGSNHEILVDYLKEAELAPKSLDLVEKFAGENSSDLADYTKALLLGTSINNSLPFSTGDESGITENKTRTKIALPTINFSRKKLLFGFVAIVLIVSLTFLILNSTKNFSKKTIVPSTKKSTISAQSKNTTVSATKSPLVNQKPPTPIINKVDFKIKVLNGTPTQGLAAQTKDFLVIRGFNVVATGNAVNDTFAQTSVQFKPSKTAIQTDLTIALSERYSIVIGDPLAESDPVDIIIILGRK